MSDAGNIKFHVGVVTAAYDDLSLDVDLPTLADAAIPGIRPLFVTPNRWAPAEGTRVVIIERATSAGLAESLAWLGNEWIDRESTTQDATERAVVPTDLDPGDQRWRSNEGRVVIQLEDGVHESAPGAGLPAVRLGRKDATEPLLLGTQYKAWMEATVQAVRDFRAATEALRTALAAFSTTSQQALDPVLVAAAVTLSAALIPVGTSLATVEATLTTQKGTITPHLSTFVYTALAPEQGQ